MEENALDPPEETCPEGLTFYDLRPYFASSHYAQEPLASNIAIHMEGCAACRERWQFLVDTDPRLSEAYWQEIEELSTQVLEGDQMVAEPVSNNINDLTVDLAKGNLDPTVEQVYQVWQAVRSIEDEDERESAASYLADACDFLLERRGEASKALIRLKEIESGRSDEPLLIVSTLDALAVAVCKFTAFIQDVIVMEIHGGVGYLHPDRFRRAKELFQIQQLYRANLPIKT